jgi:hypothetical protein
MVGDIILIGPYGAGKTEIAHHLSHRLQVLRQGLDLDPFRYYAECEGCDQAEATSREIDDPWWQPYCAHAIKRFLQELEAEHCIMDFGAHHPVLDGDLFNEIEQLLLPYFVVLLIPSPDRDESMRILEERNSYHFVKKERPHARMNTYFINHPAYYALAKHIAYTKDKTEQETCDEIFDLYLH